MTDSRKSQWSPFIASLVIIVAIMGSVNGNAQGRPEALGIFDGQTDVGIVNPPGIAVFDQRTRAYTITSAGANLWSTTDSFHLLWKKVSGDVVLTADVKLADANSTASPHRKALLIFRRTLDADAMYADAAVHGNGETALQYRATAGDTTQDIAFEIGAPRRLRLEKLGDTITIFVSMANEPLHQVGASIRMHFNGPFYAGLGVCAHNKDAVEKAIFTNVELKTPETVAGAESQMLYSTLRTIAIDNSARMSFSVMTGPGQMEAPNWSRDGKELIFNRLGNMWTVPVEVGVGKALNLAQATQIAAGDATDCTGSHGLSPDGKWLAITCITPGNPGRRVYVVPSAGGTPRTVTEKPDSYFHSWSPDGNTIAFTRPIQGSVNIYSIPVGGGVETALTAGTGISDDPDYSPDGKWIYFNSDRAGGMQIFRMHTDGSGVEQVTRDEKRNWTPHPSPDGKSILILSYDNDVTGHPANKDVTLRILDAGTLMVRDLTEIVGGSGSDNVPNWAPDSGHFAFVSYQMLPRIASNQ